MYFKFASIRSFLLLIVSAFLLIAVSCSKNDENNPAEGTMGTVSGKVTTPAGKNVPAATVRSGNFITKTNANGEFILTLPTGIHNLIIHTGNGRIFKTVLTINIGVGQNIMLPHAQTILKQILDLAFIPGQYDQIQTLISDSLGYNAVAISVSQLGALPTYTQYGALFLNCGLLSNEDMDYFKYMNLMEYATNHGSIYASDYAVECFTGDNHMRLALQNFSSHDHQTSNSASTACINPLIGGFIPDTALCTSKIGSIGWYSDAVILDQDMITAVGNDSLDILYDMTAWEMVHSYDAPFSPFITHSTLGVLALKADLNPQSNTGNLFFTSFHTHPQGVSNEVEAILNYIILNL